jgi:acyl carrier protein
MISNVRTLPEASAIEDRVLTFLRREVLTAGVAVERETDLLSGEVLDSMSVLRLAAFVGDAFQIDIQPGDFVIESFRNVGAIAAYVRRRLADRSDARTEATDRSPGS